MCDKHARATGQRKAQRRAARVVIVLTVVLISYLGPMVLLQSANAAAQPCGQNCGNFYEGQVTSSTFWGVSGSIGFPSTTMTSPQHDGILHWLGLTNTTHWEWLQFGAWNGYGNYGSGTSTYYWYGEYNSWCNSYGGSNSGFAASDTGRSHVVYYTGESYDCGSGGAVTVYRLYGWTLNSTYSTSAWVRTATARADANSELKMYQYFEPLGGTICYGGQLSGAACGDVGWRRLQLRSGGGSWTDWAVTTIPLSTGPGYSRTTLAPHYRFKAEGIY